MEVAALCAVSARWYVRLDASGGVQRVECAGGVEVLLHSSLDDGVPKRMATISSPAT